MSQPRMIARVWTNNGVFACPVEGPERGYLRLFLTVPVGAEATGISFSPDDRTLFCAVQHQLRSSAPATIWWLAAN